MPNGLEGTSGVDGGSSVGVGGAAGTPDVSQTPSAASPAGDSDSGGSTFIADSVDSIASDLFGTSSNTEEDQEGVAGPTGTTPPAADAPPADAPPTVPDPNAPKCPDTWRAEAKAAWETLPQVAKDEILKREADMFRGLEGYKQQIENVRGLVEVVKPYMGLMKQYNIAPEPLIGSLLGAHAKLSLGSPQEKLAMFQKLAQDYGIEGFNPGEPPYVDPQVAAVQRELAELKAQNSERQQREVQQVRERLGQEIDAFAADTEAHPHFYEVAQEVAQLLRGGTATTLKDAYEKAVLLNPVTRQKVLEAQVAQKVAADQEEARKRAEAARGAAQVNVRGDTRRGSGTAPVGSMDDTLQETLRAIRTRS